MVTDVTMEVIVIVAIAVLSTVFVGSLVGLMFVCRHKYCKPTDAITREHQRQNDPNLNLVENMEDQTQLPSGVLELDNVALTPALESILENEAWVNDASGLIPHCLTILKTAHELTEKLVAMTMKNSQQLTSAESITELMSLAKRVGPRVDDVVRAMYPPLDPRLLEARCSSLVLSVSHLVLVTKNACHMSGVLDWIDQSLADVEDHLQHLQQASRLYDEQLKREPSSPTHSQSQITSFHSPANQNQGQSASVCASNQDSANVVVQVQPDLVQKSEVQTEAL